MSAAQWASRALSPMAKETLLQRSFAWRKIPYIYCIKPSVVEMTGDRCVLKVPFLRRNRNHLGSMYFGVRCTGADCSGGLFAMRLIAAGGGKVSLIFKDFRAEFLKRAEGDVHFTCLDGVA